MPDVASSMTTVGDHRQEKIGASKKDRPDRASKKYAYSCCVDFVSAFEILEAWESLQTIVVIHSFEPGSH